MSDVLKDFLISIGWAVDANSQAKAERAQAGFEERVTASDRRTTKARLREELARQAAGADTFDKRVKSAERLEQIDSKFGGLMLRRTLRQAAAQAKTGEERVHWLGRLSKAEEEHHQRGVRGLQRVAGVAVAAAATIQAATIALAAYATRVAGKLEELAYAADRTGSSVASLKQFSHAVSQLGGSAGGALNDLEAFASRLRSNPQGYTAFLRSVGVEARDAQGNIRGAAELYKEFRKNVGERKPYEQQLLYAQEMGVSEQTWRATDPAKLAAEEAAQREKYARMGYDPDKATADAKGLQRALRDMFDSLTIIGEKTTSKIFADVGDNLKGFTTFIEQHGDQIAEILSKLAQLVLAFSQALLELLTSPKVKAGLDWLLGMFGHVEEGSGKWVADTEKIKGALEALATFIATVFVAKIAGAFASILKDFAPLLRLLAPLLGSIGLGGLAAGGVAAGGLAIALGADKAVPNDEKARLTKQWDDENFGAAGTGDPGAMWGAIKRAGRWVGDKLGIGGGGGGQGMRARAARSAREDQSGGVAANPGAYKDVLDFIAKAEGTANRPGGGYNTSLANGLLLPGGQEQDLTKLTLDQIDALQTGMLRHPANRWNSSAIGRYQIVRTTLRDQRAKLGLKGSDLFDAQLQDRVGANLARQRGADPVGLRDEWASLVGAKNATAVALMQKVDPKASAAPPVVVAPTILNQFRTDVGSMATKFNDISGRINVDKARTIGAATQGFNPGDYFKSAPPIGSPGATNNSVRHQSYNRGNTVTNIYTQADARETHDLWRRHEERQKADDLRHAASVFA